MNAKLSTALIAAITLASCSTDIEVAEQASSRISNRAGVNVIAEKPGRTEAWTTANLTHFYGRAFVRNNALEPYADSDPYLASIDYDGELAGKSWKGFVRFERGTGRNLNNFVTDAEVYWPMDTPVDFYAFCSKNLVKDETYDSAFGYFTSGDVLSNKLASFGVDDANTSYYNTLNPRNSSTSPLEKPRFMTRKGEADYATRGDDDFIYAISRGRTPDASGMIPVNFRHAMSQVEFAVENRATDYKLEVLGIMLDNVPTRGRFLWDEDDTDNLQWLETSDPATDPNRSRWFFPSYQDNDNFYWSLFASDSKKMGDVTNKADKTAGFGINGFDGVSFNIPATRTGAAFITLSSTMFTTYRFRTNLSTGETLSDWSDTGDAVRTTKDGVTKITLKLRKTFITGIDMTKSGASATTFSVTAQTKDQSFKKVTADVTRTYEWDAAQKRYVLEGETTDNVISEEPLAGYGSDTEAKIYGQPMFILPHQFTPWDGKKSTVGKQARILLYVRIIPTAVGKTYRDPAFADQGYEGWVSASPVTCVAGSEEGTYKFLPNRKYRYTLVFDNNAGGVRPNPGSETPEPVIPGAGYKSVKIGVTVDEFSSDTGATQHAENSL